jgi:hypothetical protein
LALTGGMMINKIEDEIPNPFRTVKSFQLTMENVSLFDVLQIETIIYNELEFFSDNMFDNLLYEMGL